MKNNNVIDFYKWQNAKDKTLPCLLCIHYIGGKDGCSELGEVPDNVWYKLAECKHCIDYDDFLSKGIED